MFEPKEVPPLISTKLPEPDKEWKDLSIKALCAFFNNPAKYLLEKRLGIYLHERADVLDVELDIAGFRISDRVTDVYENGLIKTIYANTKPKYLLNTWIYHLIVCVLLEDKRSVQSLLLCKDAAWEFTPVSSALDIIKYLLNIDELVKSPI